MSVIYNIYIFYMCNFRLPDDIWLVDLDSNKLTPPSGMYEEIPALPEPEGTILKNHLKQVGIYAQYTYCLYI